MVQQKEQEEIIDQKLKSHIDHKDAQVTIRNIQDVSRTLLNEFMNTEERKVVFNIRSGDKVRVTRILKNRQHVFTGVCIGKKNNGYSSSITILTNEEGPTTRFEITTPFCNPNIKIEKISDVKKFKRSKLYYLRECYGKKAKVSQKLF